MRRWMTAGLATLLVALAGATPANALEGATGKIKGFYFSSPGNLAFRVTLDSTLTQCAGNFVYVESTFGNYQAYVSGLMLAQSQNKTITIIYNVKSNGYCELVEFSYNT